MVRLLVGLGNPGLRQAKSRHNLGWRVIDQLGEDFSASWRETKNYTSAHFLFNSTKVWLLKPLTYMNLSGEVIAPFAQKKGILPSEILVIHDEVALSLGQLRLKSQGGAGGHNGLTSVIVSLNTEEFTRLRLGISSPPPGIDLSTYVLANFLLEEQHLVEEMIKKASDICLQVLKEGVTKTMNATNRKPVDLL